jgi:transposase InsO family protein
VIRREASMSTARFCRLTGVPERSYRRWQARERQGRPAKGPWPTPSIDRLGPVAVAYADRYPQWGSHTIASLLRIDGVDASDSTVYRALKRAGRVLEANYQAQRRQHARARRAAFLVPPSGPNQVWQMDFSEFETRHGGTWRIGGCADYWSKLELGWHVSTTQNHRDAITAVTIAIAEAERLLGRPLLEHITDHATGEIRPVVVVTDNGSCFKSNDFAAFIAGRPELIHIRTRVKSPGQNGVRERAFQSLKYEHLYREEIDDGHQLGIEVEAYRQLFNTVRPHRSLDGRRPLDVHLEACQTPPTPNPTEPETLPLS